VREGFLKIVFILIIISASGCSKKSSGNERQEDTGSLVNTAHLDSLYEEIIIDEDTMGIIHIYSEYPGYDWVDDDDEGTACVDDAARAAIFYLRHFQITNEIASLIKAKRLLQFILYMQEDTGYFYNFIWDDHTINKSFKTSVASPDWWTWRAIWALSEGYFILNDRNEKLSDKIFQSLERVTEVLKTHLPQSGKTKFINGLEMPTWLPGETAADQAAVIIFGLIPFYAITKDTASLALISGLSQGMMLMQKGDLINFPHNAFLSWENTWHAYGNSQAHALLRAGTLLDDSVIINSALNEINNFYPYMKSHNLIDFEVKIENEKMIIKNSSEYPQIAYNIRPMVFACLEAYKITQDVRFAQQAGEIACWLFGENLEKAQIYFPGSGICYDGITDHQNINRNSGAESTIEALLILLEIEQNPVSKKIVSEFISNQKTNQSIAPLNN
jgi:hypothetical protein